jgi:two-component system response regulator HydG
LFRAVDDGYYYAAGSRRSTPVDVRLIGTTDRDVEEEVRHGRFPPELWARLQASILRVPPLRERKEDIAVLASEELERLNRRVPRPKRLTRSALARLESHSWPSNLSELQRVLEQAVVNAEGSVIDAPDLDFDLGVNLSNVFTRLEPRMRPGFSLPEYLRNLKYELVRSALRKTGDSKSEAARLLGVTPQAVHKYAATLSRLARGRIRLKDT